MGGSQNDEDLATLVTEWSQSSEAKLAPALRTKLQDVALRGIAEKLSHDTSWSAINADQLASELASQWKGMLKGKRQHQFREALGEIITELLACDQPQEVTRWIWDFCQGEESEEVLGRNVFPALELELRRKLSGILHSQRFKSVSYRVETGDLMSELYLRLLKSSISRLPRNRKQFLAMADTIVQNFLKDMEGAAWHRHEVAADKLLELRPDVRTGQDQLRVLIKAERPESKVPPAAVESILRELPERQQEIYRLRKDGKTVKEIVEKTGWSKPTIVRDYQKTAAYLKQVLSPK